MELTADARGASAVTSVQPDIWLPPLVAAGLALLATIVRCVVLLLGLLATLSKEDYLKVLS